MRRERANNIVYWDDSSTQFIPESMVVPGLNAVRTTNQQVTVSSGPVLARIMVVAAGHVPTSEGRLISNPEASCTTGSSHHLSGLRRLSVAQGPPR